MTKCYQTYDKRTFCTRGPSMYLRRNIHWVRLLACSDVELMDQTPVHMASLKTSHRGRLAVVNTTPIWSIGSNYNYIGLQMTHQILYSPSSLFVCALANSNSCNLSSMLCIALFHLSAWGFCNSWQCAHFPCKNELCYILFSCSGKNSDKGAYAAFERTTAFVFRSMRGSGLNWRFLERFGLLETRVMHIQPPASAELLKNLRDISYSRSAISALCPRFGISDCRD